MRKIKEKLMHLFSKPLIKTISLILFISILIFIYLLFIVNPILAFNIDESNDLIRYEKKPLSKGYVKIYLNDEKITNKTLDWKSRGNITFKFKRDGDYKVVLAVGDTKQTKKLTIDNTSPRITLDFPKLTNKETVTVDVKTDEKAHLTLIHDYLEVNQDSGAGKVNTNEKKIKEGKIQLTLTEGVNTYLIKATDRYSNTTKKEVHIKADFTKPKIDFQKPKYSKTYSSKDTIEVVITDNQEISKVLVENKEIKSKDSVYSFPITYKVGDNIIKIKAIDKAGNTSIYKKTVLRKVTAKSRISHSSNKTPLSETDNSCNNSVNGYNIFCQLNTLGSNMSWDSVKAKFAENYAYCLNSTGFSIHSNPHNPNQEVLSCMEKKGLDGTDNSRFKYGAEVIAANRNSASSYADGFKTSSTHWNYIKSSSTGGFGANGNWVVGYVN